MTASFHRESTPARPPRSANVSDSPASAASATSSTRGSSSCSILRRSGLVSAVYVDGGFITDKADPGDIDIIVALNKDHDWTRPLNAMQEYMAVDRKALQKRFKFDIRILPDGSEALEGYIRFFSLPNPRYHQHLADRGVVKGILRVIP